MEALVILALVCLLGWLAPRRGCDTRPALRSKEEQLARFGVAWDLGVDARDEALLVGRPRGTELGRGASRQAGLEPVRRAAETPAGRSRGTALLLRSGASIGQAACETSAGATETMGSPGSRS